MSIKYAILVILIIILMVPTVTIDGRNEAAVKNRAGVSIPILISEAKPLDFRGFSRSSGPVSVGIPLRDEDNITSIDQLGLNNASVGQFRVLKRYPDGHIWWVLVDTEVNVPENGTATIFLTNGTGNFGGENLARDMGNYIEIDTGTALFRVRKNASGPFNVIDSAKIGNQEFVSGGAVEVVSNGILYSSIYDRNYTTTIEENGPVRVCVKVEGRLYSNNGTPFMGYTLRMHFFRGKEYVKTHFTLRHAYYKESVEALPIRRAGIVLNANLSAQQSYEFARTNTTVSGVVDGEKYLFQGYNDTYYLKYPDANIREKITSYDGLNINGVHYNEYTRGWAELRDSTGKGITAAMRWMFSYWPAGFEISQSMMEVDMLSSRNPDTPRFGWGVWETREIMWDFHTDSVNNLRVLYELQYPLVGRVADFDWYRQTRAILGQSELMGFEEQMLYHQENEIEWRDVNKYSSSMGFRRYYSWSTTGGVQGDPRFDDLFNFLRTGYGVLWAMGEQGAIFRANQAIIHSDGFDYKQMRPSTINNTDSYNANFFDWAHAFGTSMFLYYYLSGNEQIKDAIRDYVEWWDYDSDDNGNIYRAQNGGENGDMRCFSRIYRFFALAHDMLQDSRTLGIMNNITYHLLRKRDIGTNDWGWSSTRGYLWMHHSSDRPRQISDFFEGRIFGDAITQNIIVYETYDPDNPYLEDLRDRLLGMGYFFLLEFSGGGEDNHTYSLYDYYLDQPNSYDNAQRPAIQGFQQTFAYKMTHNPEFLYTGWLKKMYYPGTYQAWERETQALMYVDTHRDQYSNVSYISPQGNGVVSMAASYVHKGANGLYTLNWTVPVDGIIAYQIKFSDKPIVKNLNFNQYNHTIVYHGVAIPSRGYQYDPQFYDSFWNATNVPDEPMPLGAGENQTFEVNVSQIIEDYNAKYGLVPGDPAYINYSENKTYYFAIKYWTESEIPLRIDTYSPLPTGFVNNSYYAEIEVSGGKAPYTWTIIEGYLPPGLHLNSTTGVIEGTPTQSGTYHFTVQVIDSSQPSQEVSREYVLSVQETVPEFSWFYIIVAITIIFIAFLVGYLKIKRVIL